MKNKKIKVYKEETEWNGCKVEKGVVLEGPYKGWSLGLACFSLFCQQNIDNDDKQDYNNNMEAKI